MYRFRSIKYLTTTGLVTALLLVIGYVSALLFSWVNVALIGGNSVLQLFDVIFIPFCALFPGPMLLFAGSIAGALFDLVSGVAIMIPATIVIRVLMFLVIKVLINQQWWSAIYSFAGAVAILMIGYPVTYLLIYHDWALVVKELITDSIQGSFAYCLALPIYYALHKNQVASHHHLWDDHQFDALKVQSKIKKNPKSLNN